MTVNGTLRTKPFYDGGGCTAKLKSTMSRVKYVKTLYPDEYCSKQPSSDKVVPRWSSCSKSGKTA